MDVSGIGTSNEEPAPPGPPPAQAAARVPMVERRQARRLTLGPGFQARFMVGDQLFAEVDLLDLSSGGCCLRLPQARIEAIQKGVVLGEFHFIHPDLPQGVLQGRVKWVMGRNPGSGRGGDGARYCLVGVEFHLLAPGLAKAVEEYVSARL